MSGLKGSYKYMVDQKGRVNIPAKFRSGAGTQDNYVVTPGLNGCLYVFPKEEWAKVEDKLQTLTRNDPNALRYIRLTASSAEDVQADKQGRITIPAHLLKMAKLGKEVLVNGALDRMEIWDPETFKKYIEESPESYEEVARKILI
jgi:MraZ protein